METVPVSRRIALKNILFLTDFSGPSTIALPYAAMIARAYGAKVTALHVVAPSPYTYMAQEGAAAVLDAQDDVAKDEMRRVEAGLGGLPRETMIERNVGVWPALSKILQKGEIDLIVRDTRTHRNEEGGARFNGRRSFSPDKCSGAYDRTGCANGRSQRWTVSVCALCHRFQFRFGRRSFLCGVPRTRKPIQASSSARTARAKVGEGQQISRTLGG